jgi:hypothetical protein
LKIKIANSTLVVVVLNVILLSVAGFYGCMALGVDFSNIITHSPPITQTSSGFVLVNGQYFTNGSAIEWTNLRLGENWVIINVTCTAQIQNIQLLIPNLPDGVTITCPLNNTGIPANTPVADYLQLMLTPVAGGDGMSLSTVMYVIVEEPSWGTA